MRLTEQPEEVKARNQWDQLRRTIEACGTTVQIVEPDRHCTSSLYSYIPQLSIVPEWQILYVEWQIEDFN